MAAVRREGVPIRTDAPEGTWRVVTPEGALIAQFQALVHVLAHLIHSRRESVVARALEAAVDVAAGAVAADILHVQALVVVDATSPGLVQHVSRRALAAKRTVRVDALAARTSVRHEQALVQVDPGVVSPRSLRAHPFELLCYERNCSREYPRLVKKKKSFVCDTLINVTRC